MNGAAMHSTLHVEVRLKNLDNTNYIRSDLVCEDVTDWLPRNFMQLKLNQQITHFESLPHSAMIDTIEVVDHSGPLSSDGKISRDIFDLKDVQLDVQAYELRDNDTEMLTTEAQSEEEEETPQARVTLLPNKILDGLWDALIFDTEIRARLLRFLTKMMALSRNPMLDLNVLNWNRLILLHGPPGTGKTSLCLALAQKMSIRLGRHFSQGKLIEINSQSLHSRWFGGSGKLVSKMFDEIHAQADDEECLICVLIDEVESLTSSREKSAQGSECNDALRATNQLLTGLDRLRARSNVLVFCTSNLLSAIDPAFLDRADIKQLVPPPGASAIYDILRSTVNELIRCGAIEVLETEERVLADDQQHGLLGWTVLEKRLIPPLHEVKLNMFGDEDRAGGQLWKIAQMCKGLSGRTLRRLPFAGIALYTYTETCSLSEALNALEIVAKEQKQGEERVPGTT